MLNIWSDLFIASHADVGRAVSASMLSHAVAYTPRRVGWGIALTFKSYGSEWRFHRRIFHKHFNMNVVNKFAPKMSKTAHEMLHRLAHDPEHFMEHAALYEIIVFCTPQFLSFFRMAASLSVDVAYGIDIQSSNDPHLTLVKKSLESVIACVNPGSFLVDSMPIRASTVLLEQLPLICSIKPVKHVPEWFPGANFKKRARQWRKDLEDAACIPFKIVKDRMASILNLVVWYS